MNKNAVPNDPQSPFVTSGVRIGTPAITTRGFKEEQSVALAGWICDILDHLGDADVEAQVDRQVAALCADFPSIAVDPGRTQGGPRAAFSCPARTARRLSTAAHP